MNDDLHFLHVAQRVFNAPLLVLPHVAETVGAYVRSRMEGVRPEANRFVGRPAVGPLGEWKGYRREGSVGIVSIMGELVNRGAWIGASSGLTSYEGILQQVRAAAGNSDVETIVLDINSPGGEAFGMTETAREIRKAAGGKKVVAVINSVAASAAYGLASAAHEIVVTESGIAGSIGVVMVHFDRTGQAAKNGVKATVITNTDGLDKARGHPFAALSDDDVASCGPGPTGSWMGSSSSSSTTGLSSRARRSGHSGRTPSSAKMRSRQAWPIVSAPSTMCSTNWPTGATPWPAGGRPRPGSRTTPGRNTTAPMAALCPKEGREDAKRRERGSSPSSRMAAPRPR